MPKKENRIVCINDENHSVLREEDHFAILPILKELAPDGGIQLNRKTILPLAVFRCADCGYMELYYPSNPIADITGKK